MPQGKAAARGREFAKDVSGGMIARVCLIGASVWLIGFFIWFNCLGLPNNGHVGRWMLWSLVPFDLLDLIDPPTVPGAAPWSWLYLLQRVPFLLIAAGIWVAAWGTGSIIMRLSRIRLTGADHLFFSVCLGLSMVSLTTLLLGVAGCLDRNLMIVLLALGPLLEVVLNGRSNRRLPITQRRTFPSLVSKFPMGMLGWSVFGILVLFVSVQLIGAMSPQNDFDVVEYHLGGPKEWFQLGRITRLPHNVYTNFPFLTEMLILTGMVIYGDWQWGALAGQATIAVFAPLTALGLFAAGRRWFSPSAGLFGSLVYLTSPWTYRISIIAYAEGGLACYLFASLYASLLFRRCWLNEEDAIQGNETNLSPERLEAGQGNRELTASTSSLAFLVGSMSGSAMACKYTGFVSVVIPVSLFLIWTSAGSKLFSFFRRPMLVTTTFAIGLALTIGPWLLKNAVATGNPVYPLAYRVFGGIDRDDELDAKWRNGHAAVRYAGLLERLKDLPVKMADVAGNNDWHSALMFGFAPLSFCWFFRPKRGTDGSFQETVLKVTWLFVAWQFSTWWVLTHHIDRFYVPMFSAVSLLAAIGATWTDGFLNRIVPAQLRVWRTVCSLIVVCSIMYNADVMLHLGGFNAGRMDLKSAFDIATPNRIRWLNTEFENGKLGADPKVLCVGEAQMFHARYGYLYNTVFDRCLLEELCAEPGASGKKLRSVEAIRSEFQRRGITHLDVNWAEISRYRAPGSYGYTEFVQPELFAELQRQGLLGPSLLTTSNEQTGAVTGQIFPVLK